jgi:hypothetical protein
LLHCSAASSADVVNPDFKAYDMTGLSWRPASLEAKGFEKVPVLFMCDLWNPTLGQPTTCEGADFGTINHDVVRLRAGEMLGQPIVVIDIEQTENPTSDAWYILSDKAAVTDGAIALWQELIATFREVNPDTEIMVYKPIQRIWWPMIQNRQLPFMKRGQADIDARYATAERIAPLFQDASLIAWPSAYVDREEPEIYRQERQWQIAICKELYKTRCVFAVSPFYQFARDAAGELIAVSQDWFYQIIRELEADGADGFGVWLPFRYNNSRYLEKIEVWEVKGGSDSEDHDPSVAWLSAVDRFLSERVQAEPAVPAD